MLILNYNNNARNMICGNRGDRSAPGVLNSALAWAVSSGVRSRTKSPGARGDLHFEVEFFVAPIILKSTRGRAETLQHRPVITPDIRRAVMERRGGGAGRSLADSPAVRSGAGTVKYSAALLGHISLPQNGPATGETPVYALVASVRQGSP